MYHTNSEINHVVQRLISKQEHGNWAQQEAIEYHSNGKIKTNIRLDVYESKDKSYINGFIIMHSKEDAKSLMSADSEYIPLPETIIL